MTQQNAIKIFEEKKVRTVWDDEKEKWFFSIIDVIEALTETDRPRKYWNDLKKKLQKEGSELSEKIGQLKNVARVARKELEARTGKKVVSPLNAKQALKDKND
jgi:prophage antirepressor-like protein